jgi:NO-binding membrane sensor protein with MHYT domain
MLNVAYDPLLVLSSVLVAIMAAFTGLRLTNGLAALTPSERKRSIAEAAVALGGGIWSMHFIGMLAVSFPITIGYAALPTLGSVLIAILVTGLGLLILHYGMRTQARIVAAGMLTGLGIVSMHYLGMSAISGNCIVSYNPTGVLLATAIAIASSILALELAYRRRTLVATAIGAVMLGLAISGMHYTAMVFTTFTGTGDVAFVATPALSPSVLALIVAASAFVICGLFLLMAIPFESEPALAAAANGIFPLSPGLAKSEAGPARQAALSRAFSGIGAADASVAPPDRIPYERENAIRFLHVDQISAIRADGHYTMVMRNGAEFFCPWSISRVEQVIKSPPFVRTHRSYLVNLKHVTGFKREGDKAYCLVSEDAKTRIPVSRTHIAEVQKALGLA